MAKTLSGFMLEMQEKLPAFELWWLAQNEKDPEAFPLTMEDGNEGLWDEMFQDFDLDTAQKDTTNG
jgi:hypothetical protein